MLDKVGRITFMTANIFEIGNNNSFNLLDMQNISGFSEGITDITSADFNNDGYSEIVCLGNNKLYISSFKDDNSGRLFSFFS